MCGIIGIAGQIGVVEEQLFETLLVINQLRGHHSTGVVAVRKNKNKDDTADIITHKELGSPYEAFFESKGYKDITAGKNRVLIGHGRHATSGNKTNIAGAHPFNYYNTTTKNVYCGVHNGTLLSQTGLEGHTKFEVDSENIYYDMACEDNSLLTLSKLDGAFALVWYESGSKRLMMARNSQRPLFYRFNARKEVVIWASEPWMIEQAVSRQRAKYALDPATHCVPVAKRLSFDVSLHGVWQVIKEPEETSFVLFARPHRHYEDYNYPGVYDYDCGGYGNNRTYPESRQLEVVKPYEESTSGRYGSNGEHYTSRWSNWGLGLSELEVWDKFIKGYKVSSGPGNIPITRTLYIDTFTGTELKYMEAKKILDDNCGWCSDTLEWGQAAQISSEGGQTFALCKACYSDEDIRWGLGVEEPKKYGNFSNRVFSR